MSKKLGPSEVFSILLGAIIGWGSFMLPGSRFLPEAGVINTSIGIFAGTLSIVIIEYSYRFMMSQGINEGGEFTYVFKYLGKKHGFVVGWFLFLAYLTLVPLNAMAFPMAIGKLFEGGLEFGYLYTVAGDSVYVGEILVSTIVILFFMMINLKGIKQSGRVQLVIVISLISCIAMVLVGMILNSDHTAFAKNYITDYKFDFGQVAGIFAITPFLFIGFDAVPQLVKDMGVSSKKASFMAVSALMIGMICYLSLNLATGLAYGPDEALGYDWALGSGVIQYLGNIGYIILVIALLGAVSSGINGFMVCSSKLIGAMAKERILPEKFSVVNQGGTVKYAVIFVSFISFLACFFGREVVVWIVDMCSLGAAVTYFYVCFITYRLSDNNFTRNTAFIGAGLSVFFGALLLVPISPAALSMPPLVFLIIWCIAGFCFWKSVNKEI